MKKILILIILIQFFACEKDNVNICSDLIKGKPVGHLISDQELSVVKSLFKSNNLSLENLQVYRLQKDNQGYTHVRCNQYTNNLIVFFDEVIFHFDNQNHYYFLSGELISTINVWPYSSMGTWEVGKLFLQSIKNDHFYGNDILHYENSCFTCELGYLDLNGGTSYADHNFRLVWKITPEKSQYPNALIDDSERKLLYYDNGIRY